MIRVLVVDDLPINVRVLTQELRGQGYEVLTAHNGPAALQLAATAHPDVILLDVVMPDMDGIEVCRRLKADPQLGIIPVILVTGRYEQGTVVGLDAGALDYIVKPIDGAVLTARVRAAVRVKRSHDAVLAANAQLRAEVAERNHTAEMLRHSHAELQAIYDGTADGLMIVDVETQKFLRVNAAMCSLLGYREEELLAMTVADIHPRDALPALSEKIRQSAAGNIRGITSVPTFRKDGSLLYLDVHSGTTVQYHGHTCLVAFFRDTTERRSAEAQMARHNALLLAINQVFEKSLAYGDDAEVAAEFLAVAEKLTASRMGFIGEMNEDGTYDALAVHFADHECQIPKRRSTPAHRGMAVRGLWGLVLEDGQSVIVNQPATHPDAVGTPAGHPPLNSFLGVPLRYAGKIIGMLALGNKEAGYDDADRQNVETLARALVEVLQHKRAEKARREGEELLRKKNEELRQAQKLEAIGRLAGGVAHEFNNLLQAIGGYTSYALEGLPPEEQRAADLQQVLKAVDRAADLTRQLLGFSRRRVLQRQHVDPREVLTELAKMVRPIIGEHISLHVTLHHELALVFADPGELQQALLNLCINARDAMPEGGQLTLTSEIVVREAAAGEDSGGAAPAARQVVLSIADTGCGMPAEVQQHIFEPFYTTKGVGQGTGLGLAMVYGVVQQHEGTIAVSSQPGQGTCFQICLPAVPGVAAVQSGPPATEGPGGTETILLAEDEPLVRTLMARALTEAGYHVLAAADGKQALEIFFAESPQIDLVLLDAVMPGLSGHEVYRRIRAEHREVRILFCTGYDPVTAQSGRLAEENLRLLEKPFEIPTLLQSVRETLDAVPSLNVVGTLRVP